MSSTSKRWQRILNWRCGMGWKLIVLDKSPTSDHLPPKKSQLTSNDMGWLLIFDGREGGGILGKKFSSLISFWGGLSVTDGIRGSSSRHRWARATGAIRPQCYTLLWLLWLPLYTFDTLDTPLEHCWWRCEMVTNPFLCRRVLQRKIFGAKGQGSWIQAEYKWTQK